MCLRIPGLVTAVLGACIRIARIYDVLSVLFVGQQEFLVPTLELFYERFE